VTRAYYGCKSPRPPYKQKTNLYTAGRVTWAYYGCRSPHPPYKQKTNLYIPQGEIPRLIMGVEIHALPVTENKLIYTTGRKTWAYYGCRNPRPPVTENKLIYTTGKKTWAYYVCRNPHSPYKQKTNLYTAGRVTRAYYGCRSLRPPYNRKQTYIYHREKYPGLLWVEFQPFPITENKTYIYTTGSNTQACHLG
jgi:hypothetical protein